MSAKYFIGIRTQTNEHHTVHKDGCPFLPDDGKRIYLGTFHSPRDAKHEGRRLFNNSDSCLFCSKEHPTDDREPVLAEMPLIENLLSADRLPVTWVSAFQCCVN